MFQRAIRRFDQTIMKDIRMARRRKEGRKGGCPRCGREVDMVGCESAKCIYGAIIDGMVNHAPLWMWQRIPYGSFLWNFVPGHIQLGVELRLLASDLVGRLRGR